MTPLQLTRIPTVEVCMLIRRPAGDVFQALVDPEVTTKFWYTKSSGPMVAGATLRWEWEMYDVADTVEVRQVDEDRCVVFDWGIDNDARRTVTVELTPLADGTYVTVTETWDSTDGDEVVKWIADSSGGFAFLLSAIKAWLEHDVVLRIVLDHMPADLAR